MSPIRSRSRAEPELRAARGSGRRQTVSRASSLELMENVRQNDVASFNELLRRYWRPLVAFANGFVSDEDAAQDVVQEVFVQVWQRRAEWRPSGSVDSYLYRMTRNRSLNERRNRQVHNRWRARRLSEPLSSSVTPAQNFDADELQAAVESAVQALPERRREVFLLARYHGLSRRQVAEVMGISPQTVANQLMAAMATLREALSPFLED